MRLLFRKILCKLFFFFLFSKFLVFIFTNVFSLLSFDNRQKPDNFEKPSPSQVGNKQTETQVPSCPTINPNTPTSSKPFANNGPEKVNNIEGQKQTASTEISKPLNSPASSVRTTSDRCSGFQEYNSVGNVSRVDTSKSVSKDNNNSQGLTNVQTLQHPHKNESGKGNIFQMSPSSSSFSQNPINPAETQQNTTSLLAADLSKSFTSTATNSTTPAYNSIPISSIINDTNASAYEQEAASSNNMSKSPQPSTSDAIEFSTDTPLQYIFLKSSYPTSFMDFRVEPTTTASTENPSSEVDATNETNGTHDSKAKKSEPSSSVSVSGSRVDEPAENLLPKDTDQSSNPEKLPSLPPNDDPASTPPPVPISKALVGKVNPEEPPIYVAPGVEINTTYDKKHLLFVNDIGDMKNINTYTKDANGWWPEPLVPEKGSQLPESTYESGEIPTSDTFYSREADANGDPFIDEPSESATISLAVFFQRSFAPLFNGTSPLDTNTFAEEIKIGCPGSIDYGPIDPSSDPSLNVLKFPAYSPSRPFVHRGSLTPSVAKFLTRLISLILNKQQYLKPPSEIPHLIIRKDTSALKLQSKLFRYSEKYREESKTESWKKMKVAIDTLRKNVGAAKPEFKKIIKDNIRCGGARSGHESRYAGTPLVLFSLTSMCGISHLGWKQRLAAIHHLIHWALQYSSQVHLLATKTRLDWGYNVSPTFHLNSLTSGVVDLPRKTPQNYSCYSKQFSAEYQAKSLMLLPLSDEDYATVAEKQAAPSKPVAEVAKNVETAPKADQQVEKAIEMDLAVSRSPETHDSTNNDSIIPEAPATTEPVAEPTTTVEPVVEPTADPNENIEESITEPMVPVSTIVKRIYTGYQLGAPMALGRHPIDGSIIWFVQNFDFNKPTILNQNLGVEGNTLDNKSSNSSPEQYKYPTMGAAPFQLFAESNPGLKQTPPVLNVDESEDGSGDSKPNPKYWKLLASNVEELEAFHANMVSTTQSICDEVHSEYTGHQPPDFISARVRAFSIVIAKISFALQSMLPRLKEGEALREKAEVLELKKKNRVQKANAYFRNRRTSSAIVGDFDDSEDGIGMEASENNSDDDANISARLRRTQSASRNGRFQDGDESDYDDIQVLDEEADTDSDAILILGDDVSDDEPRRSLRSSTRSMSNMYPQRQIRNQRHNSKKETVQSRNTRTHRGPKGRRNTRNVDERNVAKTIQVDDDDIVFLGSEEDTTIGKLNEPEIIDVEDEIGTKEAKAPKRSRKAGWRKDAKGDTRAAKKVNNVSDESDDDDIVYVGSESMSENEASGDIITVEDASDDDGGQDSVSVSVENNLNFEEIGVAPVRRQTRSNCKVPKSSIVPSEPDSYEQTYHTKRRKNTQYKSRNSQSSLSKELNSAETRTTTRRASIIENRAAAASQFQATNKRTYSTKKVAKRSFYVPETSFSQSDISLMDPPLVVDVESQHPKQNTFVKTSRILDVGLENDPDQSVGSVRSSRQFKRHSKVIAVSDLETEFEKDAAIPRPVRKSKRDSNIIDVPDSDKEQVDVSTQPRRKHMRNSDAIDVPESDKGREQGNTSARVSRKSKRNSGVIGVPERDKEQVDVGTKHRRKYKRSSNVITIPDSDHEKENPIEIEAAQEPVVAIPLWKSTRKSDILVVPDSSPSPVIVDSGSEDVQETVTSRSVRKSKRISNIITVLDSENENGNKDTNQQRPAPRLRGRTMPKRNVISIPGSDSEKENEDQQEDVDIQSFKKFERNSNNISAPDSENKDDNQQNATNTQTLEKSRRNNNAISIPPFSPAPVIIDAGGSDSESDSSITSWNVQHSHPPKRKNSLDIGALAPALKRVSRSKQTSRGNDGDRTLENSPVLVADTVVDVEPFDAPASNKLENESKTQSTRQSRASHRPSAIQEHVDVEEVLVSDKLRNNNGRKNQVPAVGNTKKTNRLTKRMDRKRQKHAHNNNDDDYDAEEHEETNDGVIIDVDNELQQGKNDDTMIVVEDAERNEQANVGYFSDDLFVSDIDSPPTQVNSPKSFTLDVPFNNTNTFRTPRTLVAPTSTSNSSSSSKSGQLRVPSLRNASINSGITNSSNKSDSSKKMTPRTKKFYTSPIFVGSFQESQPSSDSEDKSLDLVDDAEAIEVIKSQATTNSRKALVSQSLNKSITITRTRNTSNTTKRSNQTNSYLLSLPKLASLRTRSENPTNSAFESDDCEDEYNDDDEVVRSTQSRRLKARKAATVGANPSSRAIINSATGGPKARRAMLLRLIRKAGAGDELETENGTGNGNGNGKYRVIDVLSDGGNDDDEIVGSQRQRKTVHKAL